MNNQIATDETMPKMAEATRLRTRQLLRFSQGSSTIVFSIIFLVVGFSDYIEKIYGPGWFIYAAFFIVMALIFVSFRVDAAMKKRSPLRAAAYRGPVYQQVIAGIFILLIIGVMVFDITLPWSSNSILPGMIIFGIMSLNNFTIFIEARLPEDLASSVAFLGLSLANIGWPFFDYGWLYLIFWGLIALMQGVIQHIRWQRSARQISVETREEQEI